MLAHLFHSETSPRITDGSPLAPIHMVVSLRAYALDSLECVLISSSHEDSYQIGLSPPT